MPLLASMMISLLPQRRWDSDSITPDIKFKLRHKNQLMRAGCMEEAGALSVVLAKILHSMARHESERSAGMLMPRICV